MQVTQWKSVTKLARGSKICGFDHSFPSCFKFSYLMWNCNIFIAMLMTWSCYYKYSQALLKSAAVYPLLRVAGLTWNWCLASGVEAVSSEGMDWGKGFLGRRWGWWCWASLAMEPVLLWRGCSMGSPLACRNERALPGLAFCCSWLRAGTEASSVLSYPAACLCWGCQSVLQEAQDQALLLPFKQVT